MFQIELQKSYPILKHMIRTYNKIAKKGCQIIELYDSLKMYFKYLFNAFKNIGFGSQFHTNLQHQGLKIFIKPLVPDDHSMIYRYVGLEVTLNQV